MPVVVSDTSPVRALAHLGLIELLQALFGEVFIPPAVSSELEAPRSRLPPVLVRNWPFFTVRAARRREVVSSLETILDPGEAEAIALAHEVGADLVLIDEAVGRSVAEARGLIPMGVLGVLLRSKQRGMLGSLRPLLDRLENELGFFVGPVLREQVLEKAGEPPMSQ